jgi:hypothetical protein
MSRTPIEFDCDASLRMARAASAAASKKS